MKLSNTAISLFLAALFLAATAGLLAVAIERTEQGTNDVSTGSNTANGSLVSANVDTSDWVPYPYVGEDVRFYASIPSTWVVSYTQPPASLGEQEGSFLWFASNWGVDDTNDVSYAVGKYRDTGQDLDTWTSVKAKEIELARVTTVSARQYERNGVPMVELCANGTVSGTPAPACFVYVHQEPWIIELRFEASDSRLYEEVRKWAGIHADNFHFFEQTDTWTQYDSFNNGFSFRYPANQLEFFGPEPLRFITALTKASADNPVIQLMTTYGATHDLEKYWYTMHPHEDLTAWRLPNEIALNGQQCFMFPMQGFGSPRQDIVLCKIHEKLYRIDLMLGTHPDAVPMILSILSTVRFNDDYRVDNSVGTFRVDGQFQLEYPLSYTSVEEGYPGAYVGFLDFIPDSSMSRGLSVTYQETTLSLEECSASTECLLGWTDLAEYTRTTFKRFPALTRTDSYSYEDEPTQTSTSYVLKNNGVIYMVQASTVAGGDNTAVETMLDSLTFL